MVRLKKTGLLKQEKSSKGLGLQGLEVHEVQFNI